MLKKNHNDNFAKDIQYLEDCVSVQDMINRGNDKARNLTGWALMFLGAAGLLTLSIIDKLEKRVQKLEDKLKQS